MNNKGFITVACTSLILGATIAGPLSADDYGKSTDNSAATRDTTEKASDAWREGKLDTLYLFNRHLNNFTIDPEVRGSSVTLIGKVDSEVDKELAEQLALSIDGIARVDNQLIVVTGGEAQENRDTDDKAFSDKVEDATLTAEVKMKLLTNGETEGLSINVDTVDRVVSLSGHVDSSAEKDLAGKIAQNTEGVDHVNNRLLVQAD
jgi:osmotically-inducible protein OsmY